MVSITLKLLITTDQFSGQVQQSAGCVCVSVFGQLLNEMTFDAVQFDLV